MIRHPYDDPTPPDYFESFLNLASTQEALGVNINYTTTNARNVSAGFASTGDFVFPNFIEDLEEILSYGVRVALLYGDADYICNWVSLMPISLSPLANILFLVRRRGRFTSCQLHRCGGFSRCRIHSLPRRWC
jgi:hypothetical protein